MSLTYGECSVCGDYGIEGDIETVTCGNCYDYFHPGCAVFPVLEEDLYEDDDGQPVCSPGFCLRCQGAFLSESDRRFIDGWCEGITSSGATALTLPMLESLDKAELLNQTTVLRLPSIRTISSEAQSKLDRLHLRCFTGDIPEEIPERLILTDETARALVKRASVDLAGIRHLSDSAVAILAEQRGDLAMTNLDSLSERAAELLSEHKGYLWLSPEIELSDDVWRTLLGPEAKVPTTEELLTELSPMICVPQGYRRELAPGPLFPKEDKLALTIARVFHGERIPLDFIHIETMRPIIPANTLITIDRIRLIASNRNHLEIDPSPVRDKLFEIFSAIVIQNVEIRPPVWCPEQII